MAMVLAIARVQPCAAQGPMTCLVAAATCIWGVSGGIWEARGGQERPEEGLEAKSVQELYAFLQKVARPTISPQREPTDPDDLRSLRTAMRRQTPHRNLDTSSGTSTNTARTTTTESCLGNNQSNPGPSPGTQKAFRTRHCASVCPFEVLCCHAGYCFAIWAFAFGKYTPPPM